MKDHHCRTLGKTLSYRISSSVITGLLVFIFTGNWSISLSIFGIDFLVKLWWYYTHERIWNKIHWGKYH